MRKPLLLQLLFALCCISYMQLNAQCSNGRYYNKIFSVSNHSGVLYGGNYQFDSSWTDLKMEIYEPSGDNFAHRPLIVLAFGGSFTAGTRFSPDILTLCNEFTQRGYVTATIDYRLGFPNGSDADSNQFAALLRGVQDMRAAVRFFYKDANTTNTYRIDTNQIFIGGVSAGAFMALNYGYGKLDTLSRVAPPFAYDILNEVGGPIGNSGNPGYSDKVKGVISLSGAIADTVWIMPTDPVLVGVHGTADSLVICAYDSVYALTHPESELFGGCDILTRCANIGLPHSFYLFQGAGHAPFVLPIPLIPPASLYMDTTIQIVRDFLYQHTDCDSELVSSVNDFDNELAFTVYPNPSNDRVFIQSHFTGQMDMEVFSVDGKLIEKKTLDNTETETLSEEQLGKGLFIVHLADRDKPGNVKVSKVVFY